MIRTILHEVKEYKKASIATPLFMILEVLMEMMIPFLMASIIDDGVNAGDIGHIYGVHRPAGGNGRRKVRRQGKRRVCKEPAGDHVQPHPDIFICKY